MKTLGIHEGLSIINKSHDPKVTVLFPGHLRPKFVQDASRSASNLITRSYGKQFGILCQEKMVACLQGVMKEYSPWKGSHALFWSPREAHLIKLPLEVNKAVIAAESFHIKPLVESKEIAGDFIAVASFAGRTEILKVKPTKIEQIGIVKSKRIQKYFDIERAEILALILDGMRDEKLPILLYGSSDWMNRKARQLSALEAVIVYLAPQRSIALREETFFKQARKAMDTYFSRRRRKTLSQLYRQSKIVRRVDGVSEVSNALTDGTATEIFVADDKMIWGLWNGDGSFERRDQQMDAQDGDILNEFVQTALRQKIPVHVVPASELPQGIFCCALTVAPQAKTLSTNPMIDLFRASPTSMSVSV